MSALLETCRDARGGAVILPLRREHLPAAIRLIAHAMRDNPLILAAFGQDARQRQARLESVFATDLPRILRNGTLLGAFDGEVILGVAGMLPSGECQPSIAETLAGLPRLIPTLGIGGLLRLGRWLQAWKTHDLREPHWHLGPVAVDARYQGHGAGHVLLAESCRILDAAGIAGYLETDKPENVAFYREFGFETVAEALVLGQPNWFLRRQPDTPQRLALQ